jgi:hydrogenase maturation factor
MSCSRETHCITCADEGTPMRVERVDRGSSLALCTAEDGSRATVDTSLVDCVAPGSELLVHAGVALVTLGERVTA